MQTRYFAGSTLARAGDEMTGPAVVLLAFAITGAPAMGAVLMACLTVAAAIGGPAFGAMLDRNPRPERVLGYALAGYAAGILVIQATTGRAPLAIAAVCALAAGTLSPAVAGGWTSQLPRVVTADELPRASALDAMSFSAASLAGPALASLTALWLGARVAVAVAAGLVAVAVPAALGLAPPERQPQRTRISVAGEMLAGLTEIARRPALLRATLTSAVSYTGIGMLLVCCPLLGQERLGGSARGALLISAAAVASLTANALLARRRWRHGPDVRVLVSTLFIGVSIALTALAPGWFTMAAMALDGIGEGPQLTALFTVRHREAPEHLRGRIFTTAASLKIAGLAAGSALAGPLAGWSVTGCLLVAAGIEACAAGAYLLVRTGSTTGRSDILGL
jgi:MFS family permease